MLPLVEQGLQLVAINAQRLGGRVQIEAVARLVLDPPSGCLAMKVGAWEIQFPSGCMPMISEWACWAIWRIRVFR